MTSKFRGLAAAVLLVAAPSINLSAQTVPTSSEQSQTSTDSDAALATRVKAALHADPYFYDTHVEVAVVKGDVVLKGFVFSDWDMRNAIRIANGAAGGRNVVNNLSIKEGGRH